MSRKCPYNVVFQGNVYVLPDLKELSVRFHARRGLMESTASTLANAMYRTQLGVMQLLANAFANMDGGVSSVF